MNVEEIVAAASSCPFCKALRVVGSTASTNDDLLAEARAGAPHGQVLIADSQTMGRGRLGRSWESPSGVNLYLSLLIRPEIDDVSALTPLALVAGLAVAEAVRSLPGVDARVKWPNDVLVDGKKLAGILMEAVENRSGEPALVIGVGLNVNQEIFTSELEPIATSLRLLTGRSFSREIITGRILERLHLRLNQALEGEVEKVLADWSAISSTIGRRVRPQDGPEGLALRVDTTGALVVRDEAGELHQVIAGLIEEV